MHILKLNFTKKYFNEKFEKKKIKYFVFVFKLEIKQIYTVCPNMTYSKYKYTVYVYNISYNNNELFLFLLL